MKKIYLDDEEKDIIESIERGEWKSVKILKKQSRSISSMQEIPFVKINE